MNRQSKMLRILLAIVAVGVLCLVTAPAIVSQVHLEQRKKACHEFCTALRSRLNSVPEMAKVEVSVITDGHVNISGHLPAGAEPRLLTVINDIRHTNRVALNLQVEEDHARLVGGADAGKALTITRVDADSGESIVLK